MPRHVGGGKQTAFAHYCTHSPDRFRLVFQKLENVYRAPNEANQRAPLMTLTALGRKRLAAYGATIRRALGALSTHFDAEDVEQAAATVRRLRELLQPAARP